MNNSTRMTEYGMVKYDDFGVDQFTHDDQPVAVAVRTTVRKRPQEAQMKKMIGLLDPKAQAKAVSARRALEIRMRTADPSVTREVDILDDDEVVWLTDDMAITVAADQVDHFRRWVASRGLAPYGARSYTVTQFVDGPVGYAAIIAAVSP